MTWSLFTNPRPPRSTLAERAAEQQRDMRKYGPRFYATGVRVENMNWHFRTSGSRRNYTRRTASHLDYHFDYVAPAVGPHVRLAATMYEAIAWWSFGEKAWIE